MQNFSASPVEIFRSLFNNYGLIVNLIQREIQGRYKGSVVGILWSLIHPVFMLAIYTFVFSVVFKARWNNGNESRTEFALVLFAGLMVFNFFAECLNRAPTLIINNVNYVKKVVFPLEILAFVAIGSALFHFAISLIVWLIAYVVFYGIPHTSILLLPFVLIPLMFFTTGIVWIFSALGVFLRDIAQLIGMVTTVLMFLSPIFYPISALPEKYRFYLQLNPITPSIEFLRDILYWGVVPNPIALLILFIMSLFFAWLGFLLFQKTRKGFADVL
jgi:lipopolysaccharide transport system permease protein